MKPVTDSHVVDRIVRPHEIGLIDVMEFSRYYSDEDFEVRDAAYVSVTNNTELRCIRPNSHLEWYLMTYLPHVNPTREYPLGYYYGWIIGDIEKRELFDETNSTMIISDESLWWISYMRAFHRYQLIQVIIENTYPHDEPQARMASYLPEKPERFYTSHGLPFYRKVPLNPIPRNVIPSPSTYFYLTPELKEAFGQYDGPFRYDTIIKWYIAYIYERRRSLISRSNPFVILCSENLLGEAFGVRTFHRTESMILLHTCLTYA